MSVEGSFFGEEQSCESPNAVLGVDTQRGNIVRKRHLLSRLSWIMGFVAGL